MLNIYALDSHTKGGVDFIHKTDRDYDEEKKKKKTKKKLTVVNLLLVDNHFFLITDLINFMAGVGGHAKPSRSLVCQHCLYRFSTKEAFTIHEYMCEQQPFQKLSSP